MVKRRHKPISRSVEEISSLDPRKANKQGGATTSLTTIRHTTAVHLLRAGVDINTIRAWLGHVSLDTTNIYAEVDLEMKAKALSKVDVSDLASQSARPEALPSLMAFMRGL